MSSPYSSTPLDGLPASVSSKLSSRKMIISSWTDFHTIASKKDPTPPPKIFTSLHISIKNKGPVFWKKSDQRIPIMRSSSSLKVCFQWIQTHPTSWLTKKSVNNMTLSYWSIAPMISVTLDKKAEDSGRFKALQICQIFCCWVLEANV